MRGSKYAHAIHTCVIYPHGNGGKGGHIYLVREIYEQIPPGTRFIPELVEDGILFRRVTTDTNAKPSWAMEIGNNGNGNGQ